MFSALRVPTRSMRTRGKHKRRPRIPITTGKSDVHWSMDTNRFSSQRVVRRKPRPVEYLGMTVPLWIGAGAAAAVILGALVFLLTDWGLV